MVAMFPVTGHVQLCAVHSVVAMVRFALEPAAQDAAKREVAACKRLADLQGVQHLRLEAYGETLGWTAEYLEVCP